MSLNYDKITASLKAEQVIKGKLSLPERYVGPEGPQGPEGKSAYQTALDNGFVGTEEEWLLSLVGPQGPQGEDGEQGLPGEKGDQGPAGESGVYVGTEEPTDPDQIVWINPEGEVPESPDVDLSNYYNKQEIDRKLAEMEPTGDDRLRIDEVVNIGDKSALMVGVELPSTYFNRKPVYGDIFLLLFMYKDGDVTRNGIGYCEVTDDRNEQRIQFYVNDYFNLGDVSVMEVQKMINDKFDSIIDGDGVSY